MRFQAHLTCLLGIILATATLHCGPPSSDGDPKGDVADGDANAGVDAGPGTPGDAGDAGADGGSTDAAPGTVDATDVKVAEDAAEDATQADAEVPDASAHDTGPADAGPSDAEPADAAPVDAGPADAGITDTGPSDATDASAPDAASDAGPDDAGPDDAGTADTGGEDTWTPNPACQTPKPLPIAFTTVKGFGGSEDFAMDYSGNVVLNKGGSIARVSPTGAVHIVAPNAGATAGISVLSNNDIVFAAGDKLKIAYATGGYETILAGLSYPNGMDVDHEDYAYVAEQSGGRLRRVNPYTGEFQIVADKLPNPNGVGWAPGFKRVYVGSFGSGTVHAIDRLPDGGWSAPVLFAKIDGDKTVTGPPPEPIDPPEVVYAPCDGKAEGAPCLTHAGWEGACKAEECVQLPSALPPEDAACEGAEAQAACSVSILGFPFPGKCVSSSFSADCCATKPSPGCGNSGCEDCICAVDPFCCTGNWDGLCVNQTKTVCPTECNCDQTLPVDGPAVCLHQPDPAAFCAGLAIDDVCAYIEDAETIRGGTCMDVAGLKLGSPFPAKGVACVPPDALIPSSGGGGGGGLDGLNVDECGTVWVTEYVLGYLWRISSDGVIYKAAKLSSWIPNIDFGRGLGGFPKTTMYVMDYTANQLFALDIGVEGKWAVPPLP